MQRESFTDTYSSIEMCVCVCKGYIGTSLIPCLGYEERCGFGGVLCVCVCVCMKKFPRISKYVFV